MSQEFLDTSLVGMDLPEWGDSIENVRLLRRQLQVVQDIRAELGRKNTVIASLRLENEELEAQLRHLSSAADQAAHLDQRCIQLSHDFGVVQGRAAEWEGRALAMEEKYRNVASRVDELGDELNSKDRTIHHLEDSIANLQGELNEVRAQYNREVRLKEGMETANKQVESNLSGALQREQQRCKEQDEMLREKEGQVMMLLEVKRQKEDLEQKILKLQQEYKIASETNNKGREQLQNNVQGLKLELQEQKSRCALLEDDHRAISSLLQAKEEVLAQMESESHIRFELDANLRTTQKENEQLQQKATEYLAKLNLADGLIRELRGLVRRSSSSQRSRLSASRSPFRSTSAERSFADQDSPADTGSTLVFEVSDMLKELEELRVAIQELPRSQKANIENEQKLQQEKLLRDDLSEKVSALSQRNERLEADLSTAKRQAESRGNLLENFLHQLQAANIYPASFSPGERGQNDPVSLVTQGFHRLMQSFSEIEMMRQRQAEAEVAAETLRTELVEETEQHKREIKQMEKNFVKERESFRTQLQSQMSEVLKTAKDVEAKAISSKTKQREKGERVEAELRSKILSLEEYNSKLLLQCQEAKHHTQRNHLLLKQLENLIILLVRGTVPIVQRCKDMLHQKAFLARENKSFSGISGQLSVLSSIVDKSDEVPSQASRRPVEQLIDTPYSSPWESEASEALPPSFRAVVVAVIAARRLFLFMLASASKKTYFLRRFPFCLLTEEDIEPCASPVLDVRPGLDGWIQLVQLFSAQKNLDGDILAGKNQLSYSGSVESNLVLDLNIGLQQHQRRLWERGLLYQDDGNRNQVFFNRVAAARNQRYSPSNMSLQAGWMNQMIKVRQKVTQLATNNVEQGRVVTELFKQLEEKAQFQGSIDAERQRLEELQETLREMENRSRVKQKLLEEDLQERDQRLQDLERKLRRSTEQSEMMKNSYDQVQEELFQLHAYMKRCEAIAKDDEYQRLMSRQPLPLNDRSSYRSPIKDRSRSISPTKSRFRSEEKRYETERQNGSSSTWEDSYRAKERGREAMPSPYTSEYQRPVSISRSKEMASMERKLKEQSYLAKDIGNLVKKADLALSSHNR